MDNILFFDLEAGERDGKITDIGAVYREHRFHDRSIDAFGRFAAQAAYACGHNILAHDVPLLEQSQLDRSFFTKPFIDTLYLSALLFPEKPYHHLVKDYKLNKESVNDPLADVLLVKQLFADEVNRFNELPGEQKAIYAGLLSDQSQFKGFFQALGYGGALPVQEMVKRVQAFYDERLCMDADLEALASMQPVELAYALAIISTRNADSITPPWLLKRYPQVNEVIYRLRSKPCANEHCAYCTQKLDPYKALYNFFGYESFRKFEAGETVPLQERVVKAALKEDSLLGIFPTGGGKSLAFQLPALMAGEANRALTVVISPLQSLMKDQVDVLNKRHSIVKAVTINGLLSPLERKKAIERVREGGVHLLYISPESLRSKTIFDLLCDRLIARVVIDEAHCFSSWGQDFRVDYLYIGDFISELQKAKQQERPIPVSCFTATAKPQVIEDIKAYFRHKLGLELTLYKTNARRTNLSYSIYDAPTREVKYQKLKNLLDQKAGAKIVYVSRTKTAEKIAESLAQEGFKALAYHGKMNTDEKIRNQEAFMSNEADVIVATSAFGMGVDKSDIEMVVHYEISDSLENYIQEAGRAGRSESISAECYVLFNEDDLNKHFSLLNTTKINHKEIAQVWKAIKYISGNKEKFCKSALQIAKKAGWDDDVRGIENRITAAVAALEDCGYIKRSLNTSRIFATSLIVKSIEKANAIIRQSQHFTEDEKMTAIDMVKIIVREDETRVDYLAENLGKNIYEIKQVLNKLQEEKILGYTTDLTAFIDISKGNSNSAKILSFYNQLENILLEILPDKDTIVSLKEVNETVEAMGLQGCTIDRIKDILRCWEIKHYLTKERLERNANAYHIRFIIDRQTLKDKVEKRQEAAVLAMDFLASKMEREITADSSKRDKALEFSLGELKEKIEGSDDMFAGTRRLHEYEEALLYLNLISSIKLEDGFLVLYKALNIERLEKDNRKKFTKDDYAKLDAFYKHRIEQIHIVGEYAKKMLRNHKEALTFVDDYFTLDYADFIRKYFPNRKTEIQRPVTASKFEELFGKLSAGQLEIVKDNVSKKILVAAGPGSGKTRVLVHKVGSLLMMEDIKPDQFLMLTFSRAAAMEFRTRLYELVGPIANYIEINTYHSYCFNLLGRVGTLEKSDAIIKKAVEAMRDGSIPDTSYTNKSVLVVDEFQDINGDEHDLLQEIIKQAEDIRVVAVGDDDQNIYEFRKADNKYMKEFGADAKRYDLLMNFRSRQNLVHFSNQFLKSINNRVKNEFIIPKSNEDGKIKIVSHAGAELIVPLVQDLIKNNYEGTTAVLTATNEDAALAETVLKQNGIPVRLILASDSFALYNLVELRFFSGLLDNDTEGKLGLIPDESWKQAKLQLAERYKDSIRLELALSVINRFEKETSRKSRIDWRNYLAESNIEDFYSPGKEQVIVSTMHKAKGKEFDNVYLMLNNYRLRDDAARRVVYVAITRAKNNLIIHQHQMNCFDAIYVDALEKVNDATVHHPAKEISLHASLKGVQLWYFDKPPAAARVPQLKAGEILLSVSGDTLLNDITGVSVAKLSAKMNEEITRWKQKGYAVQKAQVNYVVWWRDKDSGKEYPVILPAWTMVRE